MIPLIVFIKWRTRTQRRFGIWLPLFLLWLALLPIVLLLLPFFVIACLLARMNPFRLFVAGWRLLAGLPGTRIEFEHQHHMVLLRIV
jgi:hypothetical protein